MPFTVWLVLIFRYFEWPLEFGVDSVAAGVLLYCIFLLSVCAICCVMYSTYYYEIVF